MYDCNYYVKFTVSDGVEFSLALTIILQATKLKTEKL